MKLSFKFKPNVNEQQLKIIEELSFHTTKLYNIVNYDLRENEFKSYVDIEKNSSLIGTVIFFIAIRDNKHLRC